MSGSDKWEVLRWITKEKREKKADHREEHLVPTGSVVIEFLENFQTAAMFLHTFLYLRLPLCK